MLIHLLLLTIVESFPVNELPDLSVTNKTLEPTLGDNIKITFGCPKPFKVPAGKGPVPHQIWAYWGNEDLPWLVDACVKGWIHKNPSFQINILTKETVHECLPGIVQPHDFPDDKAALFSDWIRLNLLKMHGGTWIDISSVAITNFSWINLMALLHNTEGVIYKSLQIGASADVPYYDSWFIASKPNNTFISAWLDEFNYLLRDHFYDGESYLQHLTKHHGIEYVNTMKRGFGSRLDLYNYWVVFWSMLKITVIDGLSPNLTVMNSDQGPLSIYAKEGWIQSNVQKAIVSKPNNLDSQVYILKFVGDTRNYLTKNIPKVPAFRIHPDSIYIKYIYPYIPAKTSENWHQNPNLSLMFHKIGDFLKNISHFAGKTWTKIKNSAIGLYFWLQKKQ